METSHPQALFRLDNETLAFRYTATVSHRNGDPLERLDDPVKLRQWLAANDLDPGVIPTSDQLDQARQLREAIYRLGATLADGANAGSARSRSCEQCGSRGHAESCPRCRRHALEPGQ